MRLEFACRVKLLGTFVNDSRLSEDGKASEPRELKNGDRINFGLDIFAEDGKELLHRRIHAKVVIVDEDLSYQGASTSITDVRVWCSFCI